MKSSMKLDLRNVHHFFSRNFSQESVTRKLLKFQSPNSFILVFKSRLSLQADLGHPEEAATPPM